MQLRKQQFELDMKTTDSFQIEKGVHQGCILSPCLLNLYAEYIMRNAGLEETQDRAVWFWFFIKMIKIPVVIEPFSC